MTILRPLLHIFPGGSCLTSRWHAGKAAERSVSKGRMRPWREPLILVALLWSGCQKTEGMSGAGTAGAGAAAFRATRVSAAVGVAARSTCPSEADDAYFFPVASFESRGAGLHSGLSRRKFSSEELLRMGEPSLSCGAVPHDGFRFVWLRSFHPPVAVRVSLGRDSVELVATEMSGSGRPAPGGVVDQLRRRLSTAEWEDLEGALARATFWQLSSAGDEGGPDGAHWIVEGRVGPRYHVVDRWSPRGAFRDLGLLFVKLSQLSVAERDVY